jgi:hypothetical protein
MQLDGKTKQSIRPISEPPPPPLPESPPPASPFGSTPSIGDELISAFTAEEVDQILNCGLDLINHKQNSSVAHKSRNLDDYEQPIGAPPLDQSTTGSDRITPPPGFVDNEPEVKVAPNYETVDSDSGSECVSAATTSGPETPKKADMSSVSASNTCSPPLTGSLTRARSPLPVERRLSVNLNSSIGSRPLSVVSPDSKLKGWRPLSSSMLQLPTEFGRPKLPRNRIDSTVNSSTLSQPRFVVRNLPTRLKSLPEILSSRINLSERIYGSNDESGNKDGSNANNEMALRPLPPLPLQHYPWYHDIEREQATVMLSQLGKEGAFLVRKSKRAGDSNPFSLTIFHGGKVFNLNIRRREDRLFALGKQKDKEKVRTFVNLIFYLIFYLILIIFLHFFLFFRLSNRFHN